MNKEEILKKLAAGGFEVEAASKMLAEHLGFVSAAANGEGQGRSDLHSAPLVGRCRRPSIVLNDNVVVTVLGVKGDTVRLGINAPLEIPFPRQEVYEKVLNEEVLMSLR